MCRAAITFLAALLVAPFAAAQGIIRTVAGGGPNNLPATQAYLGNPTGVARDVAGNLYVASGSRVFKVDPAGILTVFAGTGRSGFSGDGGPAPSASLDLAAAVALTADGTLYIADSSNYRIRKVDLAGSITTVAGSGAAGFSGDGGPAPSARLSHTSSVAVAADGTLYIADLENHRVRKVDPAGRITTVAGSGTQGFSGDGGPALNARLSFPSAVAVAADGTLYFADLGNYRIRKVDPAGTIATVAGSGIPGFSGDGGAAVGARLAFPSDVAVASDGSLYIADANNNRIRKVDAAGTITTVVGSGRTGYAGAGFSGDGGLATRARLVRPRRVTVAGDGSLYIADSGNNRIRKVDPAGTITTVAGSGTPGFSGDGGPAPSASLSGAGRFVVAVDGTLYIADSANNRVRMVDPAGTISTVAGSGREGFSGDGGPAIRASLYPVGVAVAPDGSLYIADIQNHRIRKVDPAGTVSTAAGSGRTGYRGGGFSGDGGPATRARLAYPEDVAVAADGTVYICERANHRVRKVDPAGTITTVAGTGAGGFSGDGGPASSARLLGPSGVAVAADGTLYIADGSRIRKVDRAGTITTVAGTGAAGFSGDGGPAIRANLNGPLGVAVAPDGSLYIADTQNHRIRKVDPAGTISTVVGSGTRGFSGDGGPATRASLDVPVSVAVASDGSLYIADSSNRRIRRVVFSAAQPR